MPFHKGVDADGKLEDLDINGWDIRNAFGLLSKSNPSFIECLGSPISYMENRSALQKIRKLSPTFYSQTTSSYHFFSMAKKHFRGYLRGDRVRTKKYFYLLRPLVAVLWLESGLGPIPTEFEKLVERNLPDGDLKCATYDLIEQKRSGAEMDEGPRILVISEFVEEQLFR